MTHYMDSSIKNVTAALKSAKMWDETLVVFSADNVSDLCRVLACCQLLSQSAYCCGCICLLQGGPIYWTVSCVCALPQQL